MTETAISEERIRELIRQESKGSTTKPVLKSEAIKLKGEGLQIQADILQSIGERLQTIQGEINIEAGTVDAEKVQEAIDAGNKTIREWVKFAVVWLL